MRFIVGVLLLVMGVLMFDQSDYHIQFERLVLDSFDKRVISHAKTVTFKYNRTYTATNSTVAVAIDVGNEMKVRIQAFKMASNEYRLFPLRFMFDFCHAVAINDFGLGEFYNCGNFPRCPLVKGNFTICKWAIRPNKFPPHIPNGSYKVEVAYVYGSIDALVYSLYMTVSRPIV